MVRGRFSPGRLSMAFEIENLRGARVGVVVVGGYVWLLGCLCVCVLFMKGNFDGCESEIEGILKRYLMGNNYMKMVAARRNGLHGCSPLCVK